ncbi:hypothetical protein [Lewinella sp. W8]|uniref:hypothetical protein n=1 Tax=Lewinella sp. W8 TaxID=2528208 RepID=UPI0010671C04|nr:hypothetical protein [Lewinella sp. W8]MTB49712.1 hypothetical protein [Lewinella sp. W8]
MARFTSPDDLLRLAPDAKSLEVARRLFYSRRWRLLGGDGQWMWGEFLYGHNKAIETAVALTEGRFFCSCRARNRPCTHGLALVMILKNGQDRITVGQPPTWLRSLQFQLDKQRKPATSPKAPPRSDRRAERLALMDAGVDDLEVRLIDYARRGIADTMALREEVWHAAAARLQDAKLPGPAGRLRRIAGLTARDKETAIARTLGDLFFFVRSWKKRHQLPVDRQEELLQVGGLLPKKEQVLEQKGLVDHWLVVGGKTGREEKLTYRRTWFRGERSRRFALLLDYTFGERPFDRSWPLGASFTGSMHYYPGSYAQRALFPYPTAGGRPYDGLRGYERITDMYTNYRRALAVNPWLLSYPVYFQGVKLAVKGQQYGLLDADHQVLPIHPDFENTFSLLALSGGRAFSIFGEYDGYQLLPLSTVTGMGLQPL